MLQQDVPRITLLLVLIFGSRIYNLVSKELGIALEFTGEGIDEVATVVEVSGDDAPGVGVGDIVVRIDPKYFRPAEVETLLGDPSKAKEDLGWTPEISAREMCTEMVRADLVEAKKRRLLSESGFRP